MLRKTITGRLDFTNKEATGTEKNEFYFTFIEKLRLNEIINHETEFPEHGMIFNSAPFVRMASNGRQDALEFISELKEIVQSEKAAALGVQGNFSIFSETTTVPVLFKVEVKDGEVSYQEAEYHWLEPVTA